MPQPERGFVRVGLQLAIAAAGLVLYLATLNRWLTFSSLPLATEIGDWRWQPTLQQPVLFLLTWPIRWLPASWMPPALNVFAAVCASVTLALLARSVALLPRENLLEGKSGPAHGEQRVPTFRSAWVPPVLAALALGLQLTFWENATGAPGEMVELLLFAAAVWCLLEYRSDQRSCWMDRASFVCGIALANSWAIAGFLPLMAVALIWSTRLRFFNVRFLQHIEASAWKKALPALASDSRFFLRMVLLGLAGLSLMLLLPLLTGLSPDSPLSFWQALRDVAGSYETILLLLAKVFRYHKEVALLLVAVSLFPVLVLSIRWRHFSAQDSTHRLDLVSLIFYAAHAFLLVLCISVTFDPPFSPRRLSPQFGIPLPLLPLYYLNALSLGYYSDFFLRISRRSAGRRRPLLRALRWTVPKLAYAVLGLMLVGLLGKNLPTIRVANGGQLKQYAGFMAESLPAEGAVVCSSDVARLALLQASLDCNGKAGRYVAVDANALPSERYRAWLRRRYPKRWAEPVVAPMPGAPVRPASLNSSLDLPGIFRLLASLAQSNRVCCLEANYGLLAEQFYLRPHDLVYELKAYPPGALSGPPLTAQELSESEAFWKRVIAKGVDPLARVLHDAEQPPPGLAAWLMRRAHVTQPLPDVVRVLARWYSGALNGWGVLLQRADQSPAATPCFGKAVELNPDNLPAQVNLQCNTNRMAGKELTVAPLESIKEQLDKYRSTWAQVLTTDGPLDEPTYCYWLSAACASQNLRRQAGQQLERAQALAPKEIYLGLKLCDLLSDCRMPDRALRLAAQIQADLNRQPSSTNRNVDLAFLQAKAWFVKTNRAKALEILQSLRESNPGDAILRDRLKTAFLSIGSYTNVLPIINEQLHGDPDNVPLLHDKGLMYLMSGEFSNAIQAFTRVLLLTNSYSALIYRGRAYLQTTQFDAAVTNYQETLRIFPTSYEPYYGLAEVASRAGNTNDANRYYQQGVSNALRLADQQLQRTPDNLQILMEKGVLFSRAGEFSNAIPVFTRVLSLTNSYGGRLFRSLAYLETSQLDAAETDCLELLRLFPASYQPYSGLAEVALRRGNTNAAIQRLEQYLSIAPTNQAEFHATAARLKLLQPQTQ